MTLITQNFIIGIIIPFTSIYIRLCLEKWKVIDRWNNSKLNVLDNLANCALCYYTWSSILLTSAYSLYMNDVSFLGFFPVFTVISLIIQFKYFED